ncbi:hypothetical protein [Microvirga vignae]|nr:hypothetical protein [Microvirga vignae]
MIPTSAELTAEQQRMIALWAAGAKSIIEAHLRTSMMKGIWDLMAG